MPFNELENHPYLNKQVDDFADKENLSKYCKLIVGTFPTYAITESTPTEETGRQLRENWFEEAFIQYFYGSRWNHFWDLFCTTFNEPIPHNIFEAIELLNKHKFLITDVFSSVNRLNYSPLDNGLVNTTYNNDLRDMVLNSINLEIIYFTSKTAKKLFCHALRIPFINQYDSREVLFGKILRLVILISPAGNGRAAWHFRHHFPLLSEEINNRQNGDGYALLYRERYYVNYLSIECRHQKLKSL